MTKVEKLATTKTLPLGKRRGFAANSMLVTAYQNVFKDLGVRADVDLVLGDLAEFTGYYDTMPIDATDAMMQRAEGRREVFARILSLFGVSGEDRELLRRAALEELQVSSEEGTR